MLKIRVVTITVKYRFQKTDQLHWTCVSLLSGDRLKDGYKYEKAKVKKVKRTIPSWASVTTSKKVPVTNFAGTQNKVDNILIEAITVCTNFVNPAPNKRRAWFFFVVFVFFITYFLSIFLCSLVMTDLEFHTSPSWNILWKNTRWWSSTRRSFSLRKHWRNIWRKAPSNR